MEGNGKAEGAMEMFGAQAHIYKHARNYVNSMVLATAIQLNIPDIIHTHGKPITIPELKGREAIIANKGKVIIIDMVLGVEEDITEMKLIFDVLMMVLVTGRERTEKEYERLFIESGFTRHKITPIFGLTSLIEVFP
ncbi:trans-resveratrol di-O-methyltransferase-like [Ipomoea triloba]|uniref:trans-resveratrol di-O-methyltransferase-like n=1 Tax=Ipomoea triloba TaxID=35885 RepID=UPI00125E60B8|nr:trans-resveratrol di-O-methyltransferase-like [Ipomoea triloba]